MVQLPVIMAHSNNQPTSEGFDWINDLVNPAHPNPIPAGIDNLYLQQHLSPNQPEIMDEGGQQQQHLHDQLLAQQQGNLMMQPEQLRQLGIQLQQQLNQQFQQQQFHNPQDFNQQHLNQFGSGFQLKQEDQLQMSDQMAMGFDRGMRSPLGLDYQGSDGRASIGSGSSAGSDEGVTTGPQKKRGDKKEPKSCQVCGDVAKGHYFGAIVCIPCKTFFLRYSTEERGQFECKGNGDCAMDGPSNRVSCKFCRYQKCLAVGMHRKVRPEQTYLAKDQTACVVCGDVANGIHFGVWTCEGCKKFFRRGLKESDQYVCKNNGQCVVNPRTRNHCRKCRYEKCIAKGMSRDAIQMGRPSKSLGSPPLHSRNPRTTVIPNPQIQGRQNRLNSISSGSSSSPSWVPDDHGMNQGVRSMLMNPQSACNPNLLGQKMMDGHKMVANFNPQVGYQQDDGINDSLRSFSTPDGSVGGAWMACNNDMLGASSSGLNTKRPLNTVFKVEKGVGNYPPGQMIPMSVCKAENSPMEMLSEQNLMNFSATDISNALQTPSSQSFLMLTSGNLELKSQHLSSGSSSMNFSLSHLNKAESNSLSSKQGIVAGDLEGLNPNQANNILVTYLNHDKDNNVSKETDQMLLNRLLLSEMTPNSMKQDQKFSADLSLNARDLLGRSSAGQDPLGASGGLNLSQGLNEDDMMQRIHEMVGDNSVLQCSGGSIATSTGSEFHNFGLDSQMDTVQGVPGHGGSACSSFSSGTWSMSEAASTSGAQDHTDHQFDNSDIGFASLDFDPMSLTKDKDFGGEIVQKFMGVRCTPIYSPAPVVEQDENFTIEGISLQDLISNSWKYWRSLKRPDANVGKKDHFNLVNAILATYNSFVQVGANLNRKLSRSFSTWITKTDPSEEKLSAWIQREVVPLYTLASITYLKSIPGFQSFGLEDQQTLIRLGQSQSRILVAALNWFDPDEGNFRNFMSWREFKYGPEDPYRRKLINFALKVGELELDCCEAALLNVISVVATDIPGLKRPDLIEQVQSKILCAFESYLTEKFGVPNNRLEALCSYIPEMRRLGLIHFNMTQSPTLGVIRRT